ncbi:MAG: D-alanyl-D-alanine carboxypeptidase family protein [Evtepia sp.]
MIIRQRISLFLAFLLVFSVLLPHAYAVEPMEVAATAALLVDADHNEVLFEQNAHKKCFPASTTKVMTALLVMEAIEKGQFTPDTIVTVKQSALEDITADSSTQNIKHGEQLTVRELLYCLLCASANESANILAETVSPTIADFVALMNTRAAELGAENTHFMNTHGLHHENHYSTAYDLYLITQQAMTHPLFREIVSTDQHTVPATNLSGERLIFSTNALLSGRKFPGYTYPAAIGIKTGSTPEAGYCLISAAKEKERTFIAVVLGAENPTDPQGNIQRMQFSESSRLLKWGFQNFERKTILSPDSMMREIPVSLAKGVKYIVVKPVANIEATLLKDTDLTDLETKVTFTSETVEAPIKEGQVLGTVTASCGGTDYGTVDLVAVNDVPRSSFRFLLSRLGNLLNSVPARIVLVLLAGILALALFNRFTIYRRKVKFRKKRSEASLTASPNQKNNKNNKNSKNNKNKKSKPHAKPPHRR